jgi:murein DD-endopeptidase MepM/ murein hydrolase activator NlpD
MRPLQPPKSSRRRRSARVAGATLTASLAMLCATILSPGSSPARAAGSAQLQQRVSGDRRRVSDLSDSVSAEAKRVNELGSGISALQRQITGLQGDLDAKRVRLLALRGQLDSAGAKLRGLQATEGRAERVLARQMIGSYEADSPDIVTVVLESTGFDDLLEQLAFAQRVGHQDAQIVAKVRAARRAVAAQAILLGTLSARQQQLTDQLLYERNRIARVRLRLVTQQLAAARVRAAKAGQVASLSDQLIVLEAAQAKPQAAAPSDHSVGQGSSRSSSSSSQSSSSGGFTFPMPKGDVSPPSTWSLDDGVDIAAPGGTPELAVCSGTVVLHGIGGFGPSAPVLHCDRPLAGYNYVYYGHAGPGNGVPIGTHVDAGQVVSEVGSGIVGISSGPHLEIGFADSSGSPIGPSSASQMMSLLSAAYSR